MRLTSISKTAKSKASKALNFIAVLSIVLNTFGVSLLLTPKLNPALATDSGFITANQTVASNSVTNPDNGWLSDDNRATFNNSSDTTDYGFPDLGIPAGATIDGIEVTIEGQTTGRNLTAALWNTSNSNPDAYTSAQTATLSTTSTDNSTTLGNPTDKWGKTWAVADFADTTFKIRVEATSGGGNALLDQIQVKVTYTTNTPVANPSLSQACGLDIALVLDNSTSINSTELAQMKSAITAFTNALSGTPTQFSVTHFATTATIDQSFTSNVTTVNNAVNAIPVGGGFTNWQDGLTKAQSTFDPRLDKPNLVIFASDGNPNTIGNGSDPGGASESTAVNAGKVVADALKTGGTRILAIGIGTDLDSNNLKTISGPNMNTGNVLDSDVITTDFSGLATQLATFANQTCGGTITVNKYIDTVSESTRGGAGWQYHVAGPNSYSNDLTTDANGQDNTGTLPAGNGYSIVETSILPGYSFSSASCRNQAGAPVGSSITNGVGSINIGDSDILSCDFVNTLNRTDLSLTKSDSPDPVQAGSNITYTIDWSVSGNAPATNVVITDSIPTNTTFVSASDSGTLSAGTVTWNLGTKNPGDSGSVALVVAVDGGVANGTTISNTAVIDSNETEPVSSNTDTTVVSGSISGIKFNDLNGNGLQDQDEPGMAGWTICLNHVLNGYLIAFQVDCGTCVATDSNGYYEFGGLLAGMYTVSEENRSGWTQTAPAGGTYLVELEQGQNSTGKDFGNRLLLTELTITKNNDKEDSFINPGMNVVYTIVVTNNGEDILYDVEAVDTLPAGFTYKAGTATVEGVPTEPTITGNILVWHIGNLEPEQSATITYTATADSNAPAGTYSNIAQAQGFNRLEDPISSAEVKSAVEVKIPSVLSEITETPAVLPMTGSELPVWPLLLVAFGSTLAAIERRARKLFTK